ncbi:LAME_0F05336g1_1 [Lachancea meyersii CBS 8951]|uniref:DNA replication complex GINS protein PSF1 n=1 Tax=Lachancea meyersii CBS 8951 TaxID=1266667 RepID=A0A1G4JSR1_9SACH|nr:LAME_0F05336g1_1 [Lachancea meyersii CBS 8951]
MYCDLSSKLVLEAKRAQQLSRSSGPEQLPIYQDELVRNVVREVGQLRKNAEFLRAQQEQSEGGDKVARCQYFVTLLCMERNKRCLLAYQKLRSDALDSIAWNRNASSSAPGAMQQAGANLSHYEQEYLKDYTQLIADMKSGDYTDIDLSGSLTPPSDVFIDVRVLKDAGEIQTEYGVFNLIKDSQFFVRQADVERLIQQGYLQKL